MGFLFYGLLVGIHEFPLGPVFVGILWCSDSVVAEPLVIPRNASCNEGAGYPNGSSVLAGGGIVVLELGLVRLDMVVDRSCGEWTRLYD